MSVELERNGEARVYTKVNGDFGATAERGTGALPYGEMAVERGTVALSSPGIFFAA